MYRLSQGPLLSPTFCHILRKRIPSGSSSHVTITWLPHPSPCAVTETLSLVTLCPLHGPMALLTLCAHPCSSVPLEAGTGVHRGAEGRTGSPLSQTAFPHSITTRVPSPATDKWKEDNDPNSGCLTEIHDFRLRRTLKVWDRFSQSISQVCEKLISFSVVKKSEKKIVKKSTFNLLTVIKSSNWNLLPIHLLTASLPKPTHSPAASGQGLQPRWLLCSSLREVPNLYLA